MRKQKQKKILISVVAAVLAVAIGGGAIWFGMTHSGKDPIPVISFMDVGMTEYWGDAQESHGPVSADNIQTVFLSDTQQITEVLVKEGDMVKKGDPMMTFDTTLSGLDLERKRLEVEKLKLELLDQEEELKKIKGMRPMQIPPELPESKPDLGEELTEPYRISGKFGFDGSSQEAPLICWVQEGEGITPQMVKDILQFALDFRVNGNVNSAPSALEPQENKEDKSDADWSENAENITAQTEEQGTIEPETTETGSTETEETTEPPTEPKKVILDFYCTPADAQVTLQGNGVIWPAGRNRFEVDPGDYTFIVQHDGYKPKIDQTIRVPEEAENIRVYVELEKIPDTSGLNSAYVIFKVTKDNREKGERNAWQGMKLYQNGAFSFFDGTLIPDYTLTADLTEEEGPAFDMGSGMTASQIAELRKEQEKKIEETRLNVKMAEAEYKIKKRELEDGNIYAEFDGKVVSLLSEEEARQGRKPMIKVSGGGGFQVIGNVNELDREAMQIGQAVTVNDWNSGESYDGKVISIGDFPIRSRGYNGRGNPNSSYFPFTVFVDGEANLQAGSYVNIQYSSGGENGIYLSNPFIRTEKGESFVYVLGEGDRLEKRTVTTGKSLWGSYTEIRSGLSEEDYLAFPYGKDVKPGAKARVGDMSDFYG